MELSDIVSPKGILVNLKPNSKKQLLQELASALAPLAGVEEREVFETLLQRERLGSTGVGNGVAIPHGKLPKMDSIIGVFAQLAKPIDYESMDDQPVDLVFVLLAPEGSGADHLKALSRIARLFRDSAVLAQLRAGTEADTIYSLLTSNEKATAA